MHFVFMDSVMLTDRIIDTLIIDNAKPRVQTNVNSDKDFLVTIQKIGEIQWKILVPREYKH